MDKKIQLKDFEQNNVFPKTKVSLIVNEDGSKYNAPQPETKTDSDTKSVKIDTEGKLWTDASKIVANKDTLAEGLPELLTIEIDGINYTLESPLPFTLSDEVPADGTPLQQIIVGEDIWKIHDYASEQDIDDMFTTSTSAEEVNY